MAVSDFDKKMMARALQLAALGRGHTFSNPLVGAVITAADGRIIGEGWHRRYGGPHAEVNAVNSVREADRALLAEATIYVTLEPCSHYGKTPPCAKLLVDTGFRRVVVGSVDPNPKVSGRGIAMLREAGIEVELLKDMEAECVTLNEKFMAAHKRGFPWVTLKWACSADGFMDGTFSDDSGKQIVHQRRAEANAIIVGAGTVIADSPRLDVRLVSGTSPKPVILDRRKLLDGRPDCVVVEPLLWQQDSSILEMLRYLYREYGFVSVLVEGGASVLRGFIDEGIWDEAFVEVSPTRIEGKVKSPVLRSQPIRAQKVGQNTIFEYRNAIGALGC